MERETSPLLERMGTEAGNASLAESLTAMGYTSVFDIVRRPKSQFAAALRSQEGARDWNAEDVYDNAVTYAIQLYRSFLEHELHGDAARPVPGRSGIRGLIAKRPDYPTLFKENWAAFCRAGAFESRYGPAAYLCDLYREATEVFESEAARSEPNRILLSQRRPDLAAMIVDPGAMNEPMPMLTLVNEILVASIEGYLERTGSGDERSLYELFAERQYPLNFPYHQPHHKVQLALGEQKLTLGSLQLLARPLDRILSAEDRRAVAATALSFCTALSPPQQEMLVVPPPFAMFNLTMSDLEGAQGWLGPRLATLMIDLPADKDSSTQATASVFLTYPHEGIVEGPDAPSTASDGSALLYFPSRTAADIQLKGTWVTDSDAPKEHRMDYWAVGDNEVEDRRTRLSLRWNGSKNDHSARFVVTPLVGTNSSVGFGEVAAGFDIALHLRATSPEDFILAPEQQAYLVRTLGDTLTTGRGNSFERVDALLSKLAISTEQLDELLARGEHAPRLSPHLVLPPVLRGDVSYEASASAPYQFGAVYIHGGMPEAMDLEDRSSTAVPQWFLTALTPDRLDRLQRMVRLQRWTGLSYVELDGLVAAASRAEVRRKTVLPADESRTSLNMTLSFAGMRVIGGFRYFHDKYGISAGDFSALFDRMAVHGIGARPSLFDRWFNSTTASQEPFVLDHSEIPTSLAGDAIEETQLAAVRRLCAVLGMLPVEASYGAVAAAVQATLPAPRNPLTLSPRIVSAFFRICRAARMFGMDVTQLMVLLDLLGADHKNQAIFPQLRAADASLPSDTLDVWLDVSAVVDWLAENKWTVATLMHLLHRDGGRLAADNGLAQFVRSVASNLASAVVTSTSLVHPDLPTDVDWAAFLRTVMADGVPLVDAKGLVVTLELKPQAEQLAWLTELLRGEELPVDGDDARARAIVALGERVLAASRAQERALAVALNQTMGLPDDVAPLVVRWAGRDAEASEQWTIAELLADTMELAAAGEVKPEDIGAPYLDRVYAVRRHAIVREFGELSARAMYVLLRHPDRFGLEDSHLTLDALYLLTRYRDWRAATDVQEDALLAYLESSDGHDIGELASLLGWTTDQLAHAVDSTTAARTWRSLNTLLCRKAASERSGMPAATLAMLMALDRQADWASWLAAGDAAIAAFPV